MQQAAHRETSRSGAEDPPERTDTGPIVSYIQELARLAEANDLDTVTYLASVKDSLSEVCHPDDVHHLEEAVNNIDFDTVMEILQRVVETLCVER